MNSSQNTIRIARSLAKLGEFYWSPQGPSCHTRESFRELADGDWKTALSVFLQNYAFERAGASPQYPTAAAATVQAYQEKIPREDFVIVIWDGFQTRLGKKGLNLQNNPLTPLVKDRPSVSITSVILLLESYDYNIIRWARDKLNEEQPAEAFNKLSSIREIEKKITSFFLRDVAAAFSMDEWKLDPVSYLQPIDRWTQRGAEVFAEKINWNKPNEKKQKEAASILVEVSKIADVLPSLLNTGLWTFGARFALDEATFSQALSTPGTFQQFLSVRVNILKEMILSLL